MKINEDSEDETFHFDSENERYGLYFVPISTRIDNTNNETKRGSSDPAFHLKTEGFPRNSISIAFDFLRRVDAELGNRSCVKHPQIQRTTDWERFRGCIVTAGYMKIPTKFAIADIRYDMNPLSPFPDRDVATTFAEYYRQRYDLEVIDDQPLLEVKNLSKLSSCLLSKNFGSKGNDRRLSSEHSKR